MHIPWKWIKQRPHYFAEMLSQEYQSTILCKVPFKFNSKQIVGDVSEIADKFYSIPFYKLPVLNKIPILRKINSKLIKSKLKKIDDYSIVFITSWSLFYFIEDLLTDKIILVYDAMDDDTEFPFLKEDKRSLDFFYKTEKKLVNRADLILSSSLYLKNKIIYRTGTDKNIAVVNNAFSPLQKMTILEDSVKNTLATLENVIMYVGVISSWFDFSAIKNILETNSKVNVVLFGPLEADLFVHPRLHYLGVLKRDAIFEAMSYAKILIMPFIVNELIKSVNPVKVYEYISTDKHILISEYQETLKFKDFVNYYSNTEEFSQKVDLLLSSQELKEEEKDCRKEFLIHNTWNSRFEVIKELLDNKVC